MNDAATTTSPELRLGRQKTVPSMSGSLVATAIKDAFYKLNPRTLARTPVMFVVEIVSVLTTILVIRDAATGAGDVLFSAQITFWLWFTVLFANFAEAIAEGRGKAQADNLRRMRNGSRGQAAETSRRCRRSI
jgi:potassium-transporting ATPase ATP-binding subunit